MQRIASGCSQNVTKINFQFPSSKAKTRERVNILFERVRVRERDVDKLVAIWLFFRLSILLYALWNNNNSYVFLLCTYEKKLHLFCLYLFYPIGKWMKFVLKKREEIMITTAAAAAVCICQD